MSDERKFEGAPVPEGDTEKEVCAFFGFASYFGQALERELLNLVVMLQCAGLTTLTASEIDLNYEHFQKSTLGKLIEKVREKVPVAAELEASLNSALNKRNYLVHRFFSFHFENYLSKVGRRMMIEELREIAESFERLDIELGKAFTYLRHQLGIPVERVEEEYLAGLKRAQLRDH